MYSSNAAFTLSLFVGCPPTFWATASLGSDKSRGYCLEMICADFLAGVSLETGNQDALLSALTRLALNLQGPQREQLLESVQAAP